MSVEPKFKKIISKSTLIHQGPPARYQLKPKKESLDGERQEESRLRRWTLGEKNHNKVNKTILLVGQTRTGKSTMINALVNYVMGVEMDDKVWFEIVEEEKKSPSESQTSAVTVYNIFGFEDGRVPFSLTIVDTPGYGDTKGIREDAIIAEKLQDLFRSEDGINAFDAVAILVKHGTNRLDDKLKYIFDAVMSLFGKAMQSNVVIFITYSNGVPPVETLKVLEDANIKCAKDKENGAAYFMFDNCQTKAITEENKRALKYAWETTEEGMKNLSDFLENTEPQMLNETMAVLEERIQLRACIGNLQDRIKFTDMKQITIQQTQKELESDKQAIWGKKQSIEVDEPYKDKVPIPQSWRTLWNSKAVCCNVCEENCHYPGYTIAPNPSWFQVMQKDTKGSLRCTSCSKKCTPDEHVKVDWKYEIKTRKVQMKYTDIVNKYTNQENCNEQIANVIKEMETAEKEAEEIERVLRGLQAELEDLKKEQATFVEEAYQHVVRLEEIALNTSSLSVRVYLDFLIEKMKETGEEKKVQRLEKIKTQAGQGTEQGMNYMKAFSS